MTDPSVLFFDIESLPLLINGVFQLGEQTIRYDQIEKEIEICCIGYAWNNEHPKCLVFDFGKYNLHKRDDQADKKMLQEFKKIADKADLVVGHNGKNFDLAVLRSRMIKHKIEDFIPPLIDDTYLKSKAIGFTSHKLDYLLQYFEMGEKEEHEKGMWIGIQHHNKESLNKMVKYCIGDVEGLRKIYYRLKPYITSSLNLAIFKGNSRTCPYCGTEGSLIIRGYKYTSKGKFVRYECKNCHKFPTLGSNTIKKSGKYPR